MTVRFENGFICIGNNKFKIESTINGQQANLSDTEVQKKLVGMIQNLAQNIDDFSQNKKIEIEHLKNKVEVKEISSKNVQKLHLFEIKSKKLQRILIPPRFIDLPKVDQPFKEETLERTYKINGQEKGKQTCERIPVVFNDLSYVENELKRTDLNEKERDFLLNQQLSIYSLFEQGYRDQLKKSLDDLTGTEREDAEKILLSPDIFTLKMRHPEIKLDQYMNDLKNFCLDNKLQSWLSASYTRSSLLKPFKYEEGWKRYISAPINARWHKLEVGNTSQEFLRMGIFSDMRNGYVSLKRLKKINKSSNKRKEIAHLKRELFNKTYFSSATKGGLKKLKNHFLDQITPDNIPQLIEERERYLTKQMGHLIATQIERKSHLIKDGKFHLLHLSFLNENRHEVNSNGWIIDEKTEMEDMAEIFKQFNGKKVIFDLDPTEGPFSIKGDGIHLPKNGQDPITLKTTFINISVQGNTKNTPAQNEINKDNINHLDDESKKLFKEKTRKLSHAVVEGKKAYTLAEDLTLNILKANLAAVSIGCLSAKDRTGEVVETIFQNLMNTQIGKEKNPFKEDFAFQTRIAQESAPGQTELKLHLKQAFAKKELIRTISGFGKTIYYQQTKKAAPLACEAISETDITQ